MGISDNIYFAINKAAVLHSGQFRKDKQTPFIVHPYSVAFILSQYTDDEDVIIAGLLHDVLEDVQGYTRDDMLRDFNPRITEIVEGVTHNKDLEWRDRTEKYLEKIQKNKDYLMVSCADKIHNINSSIFGFEKMGESFWDSFTAEKADYKWFYESVLEIAQNNLDSPIVDELNDTIDKANKTVFSSLN